MQSVIQYQSESKTVPFGEGKTIIIKTIRPYLIQKSGKSAKKKSNSDFTACSASTGQKPQARVFNVCDLKKGANFAIIYL